MGTPAPHKQECLELLRNLFDFVSEIKEPSLFRTVARMCKLFDVRTTKVSEVLLMTPCLVVILEGQKTVFANGTSIIAKEGDFLLLPNGVEMNMINEPSPTKKTFRSVVIEFEPHALRKFAGIYPDLVGKIVWDNAASPNLISFTPNIHESESFMHLSKALARGEGGGPMIELRLFELILSLLQAKRGKMLFSLVGEDVPANTRRLLSLNPARNWTTKSVAAQLGVSVSTLSRRLRTEGQSFRHILREARMNLAMELLKEGRTSIPETADASGYASLSRFRTRFKEHFGISPDQIQI